MDTGCRTTYSLNAKVPPLGRPLATFPCRFPVAGVRHVVRVWRNHGSPVDHTSAHVLAHRRCQHLVAPPLRCFVGDVPEHAQEPLEHLYLGLVGRVKLRRLPCAGPIGASRASEKCGGESWFGARTGFPSRQSARESRRPRGIRTGAPFAARLRAAPCLPRPARKAKRGSCFGGARARRVWGGHGLWIKVRPCAPAHPGRGVRRSRSDQRRSETSVTTL